MKRLVCAFVMASAAVLAEFPVPGGGAGGGGGGFTAPSGYVLTVTSSTSASVSAATHGQGSTPFVACFEESTGEQVAARVLNSSFVGDLTIEFFPAFTGRCYVRGPGATAGAAGNVVGPTSSTNGSVAYYSGTGGKTLAGSSTFCWDAVNNRLGVGTCAPAAPAVIGDGTNFQSFGTVVSTYVGISTGNVATSTSNFYVGSNGTSTILNAPLAGGNVSLATGNSNRLTLFGSTGNVAVGSASDLNYGLHAAKSGSAATFGCYDPTATTGSTKCVFRGGAGQSGNVLSVRNNSDVEGFGVASTGALVLAANQWHTTNEGDQRLFFTASGATYVKAANSINFRRVGDVGLMSLVSTSTVKVPSTSVYGWSDSANSEAGTIDAGIGRASSGLVEINNGTLGTFRDLRVRDLITTLATPASATAACTAGTYEADANFIYICTATNTWKRVAIATW